MPKPIAQFTTNSFIDNPVGSIIIATVGGIGLMFVTIMIGLPIFFSMAALIIGILLVYGMVIGKVTYRLYENGVHQHIQRKLPYLLFKKESERTIPWKSIRSFKVGSDKQRYGGVYQYLKLYLTVSPNEIWLTDQHDKEGFNIFREAFEQQIEKGKQSTSTKNKPIEPVYNKEVNTASAKTSTQHIKQKKEFYDTWWAKIITVLFIFFTGFIILLAYLAGASITIWWKILIVMIPGTTYMTYRTFLSN